MKENKQKKVEHLANAYDSIYFAERFWRNNPRVDMFDKKRNKNFLTAFSNLIFDVFLDNRPKALDRDGRYTRYLTNNGIETSGIYTPITEKGEIL